VRSFPEIRLQPLADVGQMAPALGLCRGGSLKDITDTPIGKADRVRLKGSQVEERARVQAVNGQAFD
jgi:hypothetical protein